MTDGTTAIPLDHARQVELNFFYMHYNDAKTFARWCKEFEDNDSVHPSLHGRHAIISTVFASEALINRVLNDLTADKNVFRALEKTSTLDKWYLAPFVCSGDGYDSMPFDMSAEPFQSFKELIQIRNWLSHPNVEVFLTAMSPPNSTFSDADSMKSYPWLEMLRGEAWCQTGIPKNPFEINASHAESAIKTLDLMICALKERLHGQLYDEWLDEIVVQDTHGLHKYRAPVFTIWRGYGSASSGSMTDM